MFPHHHFLTPPQAAAAAAPHNLTPSLKSQNPHALTPSTVCQDSIFTQKKLTLPKWAQLKRTPTPNQEEEKEESARNKPQRKTLSPISPNEQVIRIFGSRFTN